MNAAKVRPRPFVALAGLLFIPLAWALATFIVRQAARDDFLGVDIARVFWCSHGAANIILLSLSIWSLRRHERWTWLGYLLMVVAGAWLPLTITLPQ